MIIDPSDYSALFSGVVRIVRHGDAWHPSRMTATLEKFYSSVPTHAIRAACTAGARLAFITDSPFVKLKLQYWRSCRNFSQSNVFIDGIEHLPIGVASNADKSEETITFTDDHSHQLEVYLPHCRETFVASIEIKDGTKVDPVPDRQKQWLAIGDSITQGMTAETPARTWAVLTARAMGWALHNIAVGGAVMQAEVGRLALELPWNIATVAFGVNDFNQNIPLAKFRVETAKILAHLLQRPNVEVYLITPIPWAGRVAPNNRGARLEDYRQALRDSAGDFPRVRVIEGTRLVDDDPNLFVDGIHPNNSGMAQFAKRLIPLLKTDRV